MRSFRKYIVIALALVLLLSMTLTAYGASGGKVMYLVTKVKYHHYDTDQKTVIEKEITKYKYNKYGMIKSITTSPDSYGYSWKESFVYNSKKQAVKVYTYEYHNGKKINTHCKKVSYNKKGFAYRVKMYWIDEGKYKLLSQTKLTWNKKGQPTKVSSYDENGKTETVERYKYNKKGLLTSYSIYYAEDKSKTITKYKYNKTC